MIHMTCDICGKEIFKSPHIKGMIDFANNERKDRFMHIQVRRKDTIAMCDYACDDCIDAVLTLFERRKAGDHSMKDEIRKLMNKKEEERQ